MRAGPLGCCGAVCALVLLLSRPALANGRFPLSNQIVFSPTDPNLIFLRASYGILRSQDNGGSWQYLCEDALGIDPNATVDPELALTQTNTLLAAVTDEGRSQKVYLGLDVSPDLGCTWNCIGGPLANQAVSDVVVRPDAPDVALAVTSTYRSPDAGGGLSSQVFQSADDGVHWSPVGMPFDSGVAFQTIDVVRGDPKRVYLSATRGVGPQTTASLFVSMDQGLNWAERPLSQFDPTTEQYLWIAGVDPMNEDRVYLRSSAPVVTGGKSRLYVTNDAGKSFQLALEFQVPPPPLNGTIPVGYGEMLGFALSPDGSKVYAGSVEKGLLMASSSDLKFQEVNSAVHVQCLATRGNELWACNSAFAKSGFIIGVSTDDGAHFCPKMTEIWSLSGPISCSGAGATFGCGTTMNGAQCKPQFDAFCLKWSLAPTPICSPDCPDLYPPGCPAGVIDAEGQCDSGSGSDAGSGLDGDSGSDSESGTGKPPASSGCGCSMYGGSAGGGLLALFAVLAGAVRQRRKIRRTSLDGMAA